MFCIIAASGARKQTRAACSLKLGRGALYLFEAACRVIIARRIFPECHSRVTLPAQGSARPDFGMPAPRAEKEQGHSCTLRELKGAPSRQIIVDDQIKDGHNPGHFTDGIILLRSQSRVFRSRHNTASRSLLLQSRAGRMPGLTRIKCSSIYFAQVSSCPG